MLIFFLFVFGFSLIVLIWAIKYLKYFKLSDGLYYREITRECEGLEWHDIGGGNQTTKFFA